LGDIIVEKTAFTMKMPDKIQHANGVLYVDGRVRGYVSGMVDATIKGVLKGEVKAMVDTSNLTSMETKMETIPAIEEQGVDKNEDSDKE